MRVRILNWQGNQDSEHLVGRLGGVAVAKIHRIPDAQVRRGEIWEVEVNSTRLEPHFQNLDDAKLFAADQLGL